MTTKPPPLDPGCCFHIYNRGNNRQCVFRTSADYDLFLRLWERFVHPVAATLALNLLPNHFHAIVRIRDEVLGCDPASIVRVNSELAVKSFSKLFNSFAKNMHSRNGTEGAVFKSPFKRKLIDNEDYLTDSIAYVILNAFRHGLVSELDAYAYSSISASILELGIIDYDALLQLFGSQQAFDDYLKAAALRFAGRL